MWRGWLGTPLCRAGRGSCLRLSEPSAFVAAQKRQHGRGWHRPRPNATAGFRDKCNAKEGQQGDCNATTQRHRIKISIVITSQYAILGIFIDGWSTMRTGLERTGLDADLPY
jgi:hypothetical protein